MRAMLLAMAVAGAVWGAAPPARLTPEQAGRMQQHAALMAEAAALLKKGDQRAYLATVQKADGLLEGVEGPLTLRVADRYRIWASGLESAKQWGAADALRVKAAAAYARVLGEGHHRAADVAREVQTGRRVARMTLSQRDALRRAQALSVRVIALHRDGKAAEALPPAEEALALTKEVLGESHHLYAASLNDLAGLHEAIGDHVAALPLFKRALAVRKKALGERHPDYAQSLNNLAMLHKDLGEHAAALPLLKQAVSAIKAALGEHHPHSATALGNLASLLQDMGDHKAALPLHQKALALRKEVLGVRHPLYAVSLNNLASILKAMGDHKAALPLYKEALTLTKEVLGVRHPSYATGLNNLAHLFQAMGNHKAALPLFTQAQEIRKVALGERHPHYADSLNNLAGLHEAMGEHAAALPLLKQAVSVYKRALGERSPRYANALNSLALLHLGMGDHKAALPLLTQAQNLRKAALGERNPRYAESLNNLAHLHSNIGDHDAALPLYRQALAVFKEALGEWHPQYALCLANLAGLHHEMGDNVAALLLCKRALALRKEVLGEGHPDYATSLNNLAMLHKAMGDFKAALPLLKQVLALRKEVLGVRHPHYALSLDNLAMLHSKMGDNKAAQRLLEQALALRSEVLGGTHPDYAHSLHNLAVLHETMGDREAALPLIKRALAVYEGALGERHAHFATSLDNLALLHEKMGDHMGALPLFERALALRKGVLGGKHPDYAKSLHNIALLHLERGRPGAALPLQEQSLALTRRHLAAEASVQSERQQIAAASALRARLNVRISIPEESAHFSHGHVLAWKGASFAAQQGRRAFARAASDPATRRLAQELLDATRSLALVSSRADEASRKRVERFALLKEEKEAELARLSEPFADALKAPSSEAYRASLPPGVALVDFLAYHGLDPEKPLKGQAPRHRLAAWVLRSDAPTVRLDLGPMGPIEGAVASWRKAIEGGRGRGSEEEVPPLEKGRPPGLRGRVWDPLEKHIKGAKVVLVSPDGALGRLPFGALPGRKEGTFLLEEVPLAVLPVPQVLGQTLRPVKGEASILALGGVDFGDGVGTWTALPATGPEADAITARFRDRLKGGVSSLSGAKATKAALREALPRHRFAHLATHGYFAPASMRSALDRDDKGKGEPDLFGREGVSGWDPGLLSGLVLAGANRPTPEDDGLLKASEIVEMDLSGVELAVLSACQTGLGKEAAGEGILGLQRAFAMAGCKSVVSSLWSVHDAATAVLMERFYHHLWEKKLSKLEALRQAQLDILRNPGWVGEREKRLAGVRGLRGVGKAAERIVAGKKERTSPIAWWAAWQLSGDWR